LNIQQTNVSNNKIKDKMASLTTPTPFERTQNVTRYDLNNTGVQISATPLTNVFAHMETFGAGANEETMMTDIYESIILDIKNGNCLPKEAVKRYNNNARFVSRPLCDDYIRKQFVYWRKKYRTRVRREREEMVQYQINQENETARQVREQSTGDFRSVPPPTSQRNIPQTRDVPPVPGYTPEVREGETKEREMPCCYDAVCMNIADLDFDIPLIWPVVNV